MKNNSFSDDVKISWISDVEGRILTEIHKKMPDEIDLPKRSEDALILPEAYSKIYLFYVIAMIAFAEGDHAAFERINAEFETELGIYAKWFMRNR